MRLSAVDHLLVFLLEGGGGYLTRMLAFWFTEDEIGKAWVEARGAVYTRRSLLTQSSGGQSTSLSSPMP